MASALFGLLPGAPVPYALNPVAYSTLIGVEFARGQCCTEPEALAALKYALSPMQEPIRAVEPEECNVGRQDL